MVKACGWIQNHMTRRKFYPVCAIRILDDQFPSVVLVWMREEQCSGKISSNPVSCSRNLPNGVVNVGSKRVPSLVSIEQRWEYCFGECRRNNQRVSAKRVQHQIAYLFRRRMSFGNLQIVFCPSGLMPRRNPAVHPFRGVQKFSCMRQFVARQHIGYGQ